MTGTVSSLKNLYVPHLEPSDAKPVEADTIMASAKVIGGKKNFWLYSKGRGYDITHPPTPSSPPIYPRIPLNTSTERAVIDPAKTALVVVDLQNYFLSPLLGRPSNSVGMNVVEQLVQHANPACRKAEIPVVWLGWGLSQQDIEEMPPTIIRGFDADANFHGPRRIGGLGSDIGRLQRDDGEVIEGGRVLMRN